jgi:hypothetical protein
VEAAERVEVCLVTVSRRFGRYRDLKIQRGLVVRKTRRGLPPPYDGPIWIGKPMK